MALYFKPVLIFQTAGKTPLFFHLFCFSAPLPSSSSDLCRFGVAATYYGISLNVTGFGLNMFLTHFIYSAIELPAKVMVYLLLKVIGRKTCMAGSQLLTGICVAINIFIPAGLFVLTNCCCADDFHCGDIDLHCGHDRLWD